MAQARCSFWTTTQRGFRTGPGPVQPPFQGFSASHRATRVEDCLTLSADRGLAERALGRLGAEDTPVETNIRSTVFSRCMANHTVDPSEDSRLRPLAKCAIVVTLLWLLE